MILSFSKTVYIKLEFYPTLTFFIDIVNINLYIYILYRFILFLVIYTCNLYKK